MKKIILAAVFSALLFSSKAQILRIATTPSAISSQVPGYSQISAINTKSYDYTPSVPQNTPVPVDEDSTTEDDKLYNYGDNISMNIVMADGNITTTTAGKVWTVRISIPNALNIGVSFSSFNLSPTAEMYVFNEARTVLDTAIKNADFTNPSNVSIGAIKGNAIIIYIIEKDNTGGVFKSSISIQKMIAGFQNIDDVGDVSNLLNGPTVNCDPHVLCQPNKINFARAVARFSSNGFGGTGTLINNENSNGRAYFLTAFHVLDVNRNIFNKPVGNGILDPDEIAALANATFQFRFWRTQCNGTVNNAFIEFTGAVLRSSFKNTDVVLLELINPPGIGDLVNYAGWDRQTAKPSDVNSFIIHHPQGEDMRITNTSNVKTWLSNNGFWTAHYSSGTVDKGSSGSALMNASGQIVGQLKGGWSNCNYTNFGDRYGKFDRSWSPAGLQTWLSPAQALQSTAILNLTDITIDGPTTVGCTTPGIFSTLPNLLDVTYQWTVTAGMQINSGQGTSTVNISRIPGSTVTTGTLTLILRSPNKGWTRIYTVANQITFGTPPLSISSSTNGCSGSYQIWNLINNTPNNGSNWLWTVSYLSTPSSQINIYSPSSPSTMLSVTGGGTVTLSYTDQCGVAQTTGVTVYNSGCFGYRVAVSPNPAKNNMSVSLAPLSSNQEITNATTATVNTTPIKVIPSNGKTIMSLFEINTNLLVKRWTYNEVTNQNYNFNINGLRKGVYVLQIDRNNTATTTKVIIQ